MNKLILTIIIIISINGEYIAPRLEDNCGRVTRVKNTTEFILLRWSLRTEIKP